MERIANWVISNKEWLFSGMAVAVIGLLGKWLYSFFKNGNGNVDKQSQSQNNSQTQNVTFNLEQHSETQKTRTFKTFICDIHLLRSYNVKLNKEL